MVRAALCAVCIAAVCNGSPPWVDIPCPVIGDDAPAVVRVFTLPDAAELPFMQLASSLLGKGSSYSRPCALSAACSFARCI